MEREIFFLTLSDFLFCLYEKIFDYYINAGCNENLIFST